MRVQIEVTVRRGPIAESRHRIEAVAVTPEGQVELETGNPGFLTTLRSAAKPFQLLPLVERGHADTWSFSEEQLAVMAASHDGSAYHLDLVRGILVRIGCTERDLACGAHDPTDAASLSELQRHPERRSALYNNCSGKHAGMLALALSEGWPTAGYELESHPLQQLMRRTVAEVAGLAPEAVLVGVDGCSVSVFGMPLTAMARAFARFAVARTDGDPRERALARIRAAMLAWPRATGGPTRFSSVLMEKSDGRVVAKGGAEGLECLALPRRGLGLAFKCEDGNARALPPAVLGVLELLDEPGADALAALTQFRTPIVHNVVGTNVGVITAEIRVLSTSGRGAA
jgi:L-asparaginase II